MVACFYPCARLLFPTRPQRNGCTDRVRQRTTAPEPAGDNGAGKNKSMAVITLSEKGGSCLRPFIAVIAAGRRLSLSSAPPLPVFLIPAVLVRRVFSLSHLTRLHPLSLFPSLPDCASCRLTRCPPFPPYPLAPLSTLSAPRTSALHGVYNPSSPGTATATVSSTGDMAALSISISISPFPVLMNP